MTIRTCLAVLGVVAGLGACCFAPVEPDSGSSDAGASPNSDAGAVCVIDGKTYPDGWIGFLTCNQCNASKNPTGWSVAPNGTTFANVLCIDGEIVQGCWVSETYYPAGGGTECGFCNGDNTQGLVLRSGSCADGGGYCDGGVCVAH